MQVFKFNRIFPVMLLAAVLSAGILSFMPMSHEADSHSGCIAAQTFDCAPSQSADFCFEYHLAVLQKLFAGLPWAGKLLLTFLAILIALLTLRIAGRQGQKFLNFKIMLKRARQRANLFKFKQIGFWLELLQKRAPFGRPARGAAGGFA